MGLFLKWLIGWPWCVHHWGVIETVDVYESDKSTRACKALFVLQCKKCGDLRKRVMKS